VETVALACRAVADEAVAVFYQTDVKHEGRWIDKGHLVHCGLDRAYSSVPETDLPAARRLVCVGRLSEEKGQLLLVQAAARLAAEGQQFELVLAGDGGLRGETASHCNVRRWHP
jgi:glycosyltransferase involved in cell wall biosynthesis